MTRAAALLLVLVLAWTGTGAAEEVDTAPPSISLQLAQSIRTPIKCPLASVRDDPIDCGDKLTAVVCEAGEWAPQRRNYPDPLQLRFVHAPLDPNRYRHA